MVAYSKSSLPSLLLTARLSITSFLNISQTSSAREVHAELAVLQDLLRSISDIKDDLQLPPSTSNAARATGHTELESHLRTLTTLLSATSPALWSKRQWAETLAGVKTVREQIAAYHAQTTRRAANTPAPTRPDAEAIRTWLTHTPDSAHRHAELCFQRHTGSCSWLLSSPQCARWLRGDVPWLLCTGEPGTGKTFLTSYLIDHLSTLGKQGVAVFYFNRMDTLRQDPCCVFRSILLQLLTLAAAIPPFTAELYNTHSIPTLSELRTAIGECAGQFECSWILLDGLEECAEVHRADILSTLWALRFRRMRVFVTSAPGVVDLWRNESSEILDLEGLVEASREETVKGVKAVVRKKMGVARWRRAVEGGAKEVEEVMGRIVESAGGVFLLAVRLTEYVRSATTEDELQARSNELPGSVTDYYAATMKTLRDSGPLGISVLEQIIASPRPLTLPELNYLVGVAAGGEGLMDHPYTPSYVSVITKGLITAAEPTGICRPVHPSLLCFLETAEPDLWVHARKKALGTYFRLFAARPGGGGEVAKGLYQCAVLNWAVYLQMHHDDRSLQMVVMDAFRSAPEALGEALRAAMRGSSALPVVRTGRAGVLHACAYWGLTALAERVLDEGGGPVAVDGEDGVDGVDGYGRTPLSWAAERGSTDVLRALVGAGAALDVACGDYAQPPLCFAAMGGHRAAVEALLSAGADPNQSSDNGQTAISWAAEHGHQDTVSLLMGTQLGIDVNARDNAGRSALDWAVHNAHEPVVRLLVAHKDIEIDSDAVWPPQPAPTPVPPAIIELLGKARRAREGEVCDAATLVETVKEVEVVSVGGGWVWALPRQTQEWGIIVVLWLVSLMALGGQQVVLIFCGSVFILLGAVWLWRKILLGLGT
ncbi:uncharacterized protein H6S33_008568 [Morchella sextelata]|uniref:uncharacterized protein n=1 Tax=Morchella sextelata TaxID=1174677 RepID=UPI001D04AA6D|nr:uncharacterized protein H6S33_008568 [Morchella sextelata]KAH0602487.1 hypothetical protein H6S33_008568 [Morchella sextelata]